MEIGLIGIRRWRRIVIGYACQCCQESSGRVGHGNVGVLKELAPEVGLAPRRCEFLVKDSQLFRTNQAYSLLTQRNTATTFPLARRAGFGRGGHRQRARSHVWRKIISRSMSAAGRPRPVF